MERLFWYQSELLNSDALIQDEYDNNGFFPFIVECVKDMLHKCGEEEADFENTLTSFFVCSNTIVLPYQGSFMRRLKEKEYKGMVNSKSFRVSPYNALASHLSIYYHTRGAAISFINTQEDDYCLEKYIEFLSVHGQTKRIIILYLDLEYVGEVNLEYIKKQHADNRRYIIKAKIRYIRKE